ncbi:alpha,alpha-trehalase [Desertifilum sp. FACHB-1129]|uniref:Alpha,alpha-trehalase n=1 Tax=Desertifilum tharense IPPAS B-1220 TaxID=1781255 RepID=A0A1E5QKM5_9CYAN|nr:trehalase family glycosidase [Desertifilum tharense]MBD2314147.1 alpha,alpha-trehalase [Desertifilum sp. FACHB-1129]MBD2320112.1 alpha,alpha-trehalase [Desertifilum sp. FACHB-866]MBD2330240.1 alpha,alpha-trehalase [Desertifilum sp. FACHB-868]MDA0211117.1 trehalase family glycosidase [Cyanobacteria bacterium FC1]OEJ75127.1 alpha,alpha-trehalase [Desertifilum tharense IPPAS B-1220]
MNSSLDFPSPSGIASIRLYIQQSWHTLTRSHKHLFASAIDPKFPHRQNHPLPVYLSAKADRPRIEQILQRTLTPSEWDKIELRILPESVAQIEEPGLLYLPHPYVVPGGRFNEMYGWDNYFIQLGLWRDGERSLAQNLTDNLLYEIQHYGKILNANRTYYLQRSQPPLLTQMILATYERSQDRTWLASTVSCIEKLYQDWISPPHLHEPTGLSRYFELGEGPAPEAISDERDEQGRTHYDRAIEYYQTHEVTAYDVRQFYDRDRHCLTPLFYKGDRTMRESGFDPSERFGPFNVDIVHYLPVCLNVLLQQMEEQTAQIYQILDQPEIAQTWINRAIQRTQRINEYCWDEQAGLYFDYNFQTQQRRSYEFATTFYPLWAGIASATQAQRLVENLPKFEAPGGLLTSTHVSGNQWDAPFGWAPLHHIAVAGLRRYGYYAAANRLACKFISLVAQEFERWGCIVEKYDVVRCTSQVSDEIEFGYSSNEIGFGWTNGVWLELLETLT